MESTSHLRRMAEELKCPICLSLLKSAVSLTCNHIFCNVCIDKSMRSDSTCPVCKIPYRRREIRPAPHMDTLVSIYKNMEVSSGVNILITQTEPQTTGHENQVENEIVCRSKTTSTPKTQNQGRNRGKTLMGSSKRSKRHNSDPARPSFPTKKRIQVPQHPLEETPTRPAHPEGGKGELIKDRTQANVSGPEDESHLHEDGETLFSPFFWVRDGEDAEKTTQLTPAGPVSDSPSDVPCFSDIKDSDDDNSCHMTSKDGGIFDSEMFEWTQRPCSPELCSSPMKLQDKESDGYGRVQEKGNRIENEDKITGEEVDNMEDVLPTLASLQIKKVNHEAKAKESKKRAKKTRESIPKKRVKRDAGEVVGISTVPLKANQDKDNISDSVKKKKQIRRRGKNASVDTSSTKALISKVANVCNGETSDHRDGSTVALFDSFSMREGSSNIHKANSIDENKKGTTNRQHMNRTRRLKTQDPSKNSITEINKAISQFPSEQSLVDGKIRGCTSRKRTEKGKVSKELKASKKVTFSMNEGSNGKSVDDIPTTPENVTSKESQPLGEVHSSSKMQSNPPGKSNATTFLQKCDNISCIRCAFCQSTEASNISGCITHYLQGKPIMSDHEGVPSAIHAHTNCTEWAPNVYFEDDIAVNLEAELARSKRIKCSCCGIKGAALGCYEKSCRRSFHFTCAKLTPQCRWDDDNFVMLCPLHASHKLPNETCGSQLQKKKKYVSKRHVNIKQSQVPVSDTVSTTSRWDSHGAFTKIVLCCSALTSIEKETIVKFEKLSGVTVLKTWNSRVTHVIASVDENGACRRTLKYLMGILEGKWILTIEWIKACMEVKKPVDEQLYEINVDIHGFKGGPKLGRSRLLNKEPKLFNAFKFYFTGDFVASYKGYLHDLIIAAGGTVLHRKPIPINHEQQFSGGSNAQQFLIYSLELPDKFKAEEANLILRRRKTDAEALARSSGAVAVSNSWILNSIAACKLQNLD